MRDEAFPARLGFSMPLCCPGSPGSTLPWASPVQRRFPWAASSRLLRPRQGKEAARPAALGMFQSQLPSLLPRSPWCLFPFSQQKPNAMQTPPLPLLAPGATVPLQRWAGVGGPAPTAVLESRRSHRAMIHLWSLTLHPVTREGGEGAKGDGICQRWQK